jgi:hypothetical protein
LQGNLIQGRIFNLQAVGGNSELRILRSFSRTDFGEGLLAFCELDHFSSTSNKVLLGQKYLLAPLKILSEGHAFISTQNYHLA